MKIKNFASLSTTTLRRDALEILDAGLMAIDTRVAVRRAVTVDSEKITVGGRSFSWSELGKIVVVGIGKCAAPSAEVLEELLADRLDRGVVLDIKLTQGTKKIRSLQGTHPFPSEENALGTRSLLETLKGLRENDLVIVIVSGGGSTLLCQPKRFACADEAKILQSLFRAGADIQKMNIVRKHLSLARGGHLAQHAYPAQVVSLIFSDVPGDDISVISSGPTVLDTSTTEDARKILEEIGSFSRGEVADTDLVETPKDEKYFRHVTNSIIVSNRFALEAMRAVAEEKGYVSEIVSTRFSGEARVIARRVLEELQKRGSRHALFYGGESTVKATGSGKGGRNREMALAGLQYVRPGQLLLSVASDGRDNGDMAGAIADTITRDLALQLGVEVEDFLNRNDSQGFFEKVGNYLETGDTGSNVADLLFTIHE